MTKIQLRFYFKMPQTGFYFIKIISAWESRSNPDWSFDSRSL